MCCYLLYGSPFSTQMITSVLWCFGPTDSICCLARYFFCRQLWHSCANSDVSWLNFVGTLIWGTWFLKESVRYYAKLLVVAKGLPKLPKHYHVAQWVHAYVLICLRALCGEYMLGFVTNIDIKILGVMKCWSAILKVALVMEEKLQIQKVNGSVAHEEATKFSHNN